MVKNLLQSFIFGTFAIVGAFVIQVFIITLLSVFNADYSINSLFYIKNTLIAVIIIAVVEETFRLLLLKRLLEVASKTNILVKGIFFGMGFFSIEFVSIAQNNMLIASPLSIFSLFLFHALVSITVLYLLSKKTSITQIITSLSIAVFFHAIYNLIVNTFSI